MVAAGIYQWNLLDAVSAVVVGTMDVEAVGAPGTLFRGGASTANDRVGWSGTSAWVFNLATATFNGAPYKFKRWQQCVLNTTVSVSNPVSIEQLDAGGNVIATHDVTSLAALVSLPGDGLAALTPSPGCPIINVLANTVKMRIRKTGSGSSADTNGAGGDDDDDDD